MKHRNRPLLFLAPTAMVFIHSLAPAQSDRAAPAQETDATHLPGMVVTGQAPIQESPVLYQSASSSGAMFTDTPLIETPFSISVYNEELIEDQRAFSLKEILENDPSISLFRTEGYYGVQGFNLRGFYVDPFNGYRVDGLPFIQTVAPMIDDKARVEILKGPAALRYGFMPPGGAINLVRKNPTPEFSTSISADVNTFGNFYSQLDVSDTISSDTFGYRLVLGGEEFNSFWDNADGNRWFGSLFTEWKAAENLRLWGSVSAQDFKRNGYYGPMISASGNKVFDNGVKTNIMQDWAHTDQNVLDASAGLELKFSDDWKIMASFNYQDSERFSELSYPYSVQDNGDFTEGAFLNDDPSTWEMWGVHTHVEGNFETGFLKHELVVGGQYRTYDSYTDRSFPDVGPNNADDLQDFPKPALGRVTRFDYTYEEYGFFLTDTVKFNDCWSVLLGARYGDIESDSWFNGAADESYGQDAWTPTAALMYAPTKNVHGYVTYTKGFEDGGTLYGPAPAFAPTNLGAQESEQWEVGVKTEWCEGRYAGEIALFQIEQDLPVLSGDTWKYSGLQRHRGVEAALRGKLTDHLQGGIAAMLLDADQVDTGDPGLDGMRPQYVPEYQVNAWAVLDIPQVPGLALTAGARFVDKQYLDQGEQFATDNYTVVDLGARYRFQAANSDWTIRLNVENVLDERYYESGEFYPGDAGYLAYGAPVSATLSLQVEF